ncbi:MAG: GNAT family N-acetyltransferase [Tannerella sp.]|jgi:ribosomal protein S18 acetylase RimI-like enzyme|nr:GNAT family N-acetyltransferase [Tannerella sp.]
MIREIKKTDFEALKVVIDSNELFPSERLDDMTADFFNNPESQDIWLTKEVDGKPIAIAYCAPERMAEGTYNLYLIAIDKSFQGKGYGSDIMIYLEELLQRNKNRMLIVETSGLPEFELTRQFYKKQDYFLAGVIPDFYQQGEDKVIFYKFIPPETLIR